MASFARCLFLFFLAGVILPCFMPSGGRAADRSDDEMLSRALRPWTGDFDGMVKRRMIRVLLPYNKTFYFLDGARQRGISYEALKQFEKRVNGDLGKKTMKVQVIFIPTARDRLFPDLQGGVGDIAVGNLTITAERKKHVDFSHPFYRGVNEIIVTGPSCPPLETLEDLSGREIHVRVSSSYYESLKKLNESFREKGLRPVVVKPADEVFEDEDLLEMVHAGLIPMIVMDDHKATFWDMILDGIDVRPDLVIRQGGDIGWAFRKGSPGLEKAVNAFIRKDGQGTAFGNDLFRRYLRDTRWIVNATASDEMRKFNETVVFFKKYGNRYDFDYLLLTAMGYQESRLDQSARSPRGAVGVMQVLPATAAHMQVDGIDRVENNIHAGTKYLRHLTDRYFSEDAMDGLNRTLFSFAAYNAGPGRIRQLRKNAKARGLDPDRWFNNVEIVAAREIGRETVQYVSNIYKYYVAYQLVLEQSRIKEEKKPKEGSLSLF